MGSDKIKVITDTSFEADVRGSAVPVLVDFWATWCAPCKQLAPAIDAVAEKYAGRLAVGKLDVDREPITAMQLDVSSIPTLILFHGGKVVWKQIGALPEAKLDSAIASQLAALAAAAP